MRAIAMTLVLLAGGTALADPMTSDAFMALSTADQTAAYAKLSRDQQAALLASLSPMQLVTLAKASLKSMGPYQGEMVKQERVDGKMLPQQTMKVGVREAPFAVRLEVMAGPSKGRRVLYNSQLRAKELRAKEAGFLGIAGGVWVDINGSLAKGDTNHVITDTCFGSAIRLIEGDIKAAEALGGLQRKDDGFDADGLYCMHVTAPKGAKTYATKSKLCFDPVLRLPVAMEIEDAKGPLETFHWRNVKPHAWTDADFTPDALGI
ncbi:MAG: DUF1571 domain-containing protein [Deltaproteobacteria bacterium]|nr:DUF1571 domain-containing protein [Deltaproteobacteria bacterium]